MGTHFNWSENTPVHRSNGILLLYIGLWMFVSFASALTAQNRETVTVTCPLDGTRVQAYTKQRTRNAGVDSDLATYAYGKHPREVNVTTCPTCLYSNTANHFSKVELSEKEKTVLHKLLDPEVKRYREEHAWRKREQYEDDAELPCHKKWLLADRIESKLGNNRRRRRDFLRNAAFCARDRIVEETLNYPDAGGLSPQSIYQTIRRRIVERTILSRKQKLQKATEQLVRIAHRGGYIRIRDRNLKRLRKWKEEIEIVEDIERWIEQEEQLWNRFIPVQEQLIQQLAGKPRTKGKNFLYLAEAKRRTGKLEAALASSSRLKKLGLPDRFRKTIRPVLDNYERARDRLHIERNENLKQWFGAARSGKQDRIEELLAEDVDVDERNENGRSAVMIAAGNGHQDVLKKLINAGAKVDVTDDVGFTPLMLAAAGTHSSIVRTLVDQGANLDVKGPAGRTALMYAAWSGHPEMTRTLIDAGADVQVQDRNGKTPLTYAIQSEHSEVVNTCIEGGADVNRTTRRGTPLIHAIRIGDKDVVVTLLEAGAEPGQAGENGVTPIISAVRTGNEEIVKQLIWEDVDVDQEIDGDSLVNYAIKNGKPAVARMLINAEASLQGTLYSAAEMGNVDLVKLLVKKGVEVNRKKKGTFSAPSLTPLMKAAEEGHVRVAKVLIDAGANINTKSEREQAKFPITPLSRAALSGETDLVKMLLKNGAKVQKPYGVKALHNAIAEGHVLIVRALMESGMDVEIRGDGGDTPLMTAAKFGELHSVKLLLQKGADVQATDESGETPLHHAAEGGNIKVVKSLIERGADVNALDEQNRTPLIKAAKWTYLKVTNVLIEKGAKIGVKDQNGRTALIHALANGSREIAKRLLQAGADLLHEDDYGRTPLIYAAGNGLSSLVKKSLEAGEEMNHQDENGNTALAYAWSNNHRDLVDTLLQNGAEGKQILQNAVSDRDYETVKTLIKHGVDLEGKQGSEALLTAIRNSDNRMKTLLKEAGASVGGEDGFRLLQKVIVDENPIAIRRHLRDGVEVDSTGNIGQTPLMVAAKHNRIESLGILLDHGADVNARDREGNTPLMIAVREGNIEAVRMLLQHDPNLSLKNADGQTASQIARRLGHDQIMVELQKAKDR